MTLNALILFLGHILLLSAFGFLWLYLPRPGEKPRYAGTRLEPLVATGFPLAVGLGTIMAAAGFLNYLVAQ